MTNRRAHIVILCEGLQDATFAYRFLKKRGWTPRQLRIEQGTHRAGAGEHYVRSRFPSELAEIRRDSVHRALIAMIDADATGQAGRLRQLESACNAAGVPPRRPDDKVAVLVPTRNIETWLRYLDGHDVDETSEYPKLQYQRDCQRHVNELVTMCGTGLRQPVPPSLQAACDEFRTRILNS